VRPTRKALRRLGFAGMLVLCAAPAGAAPAGNSWTGWGNSPERWGLAAADPSTVTRSFVLPLAGRITGQVLADEGSYFVATSAGTVASFTADGVLRWQDDVGQLANGCAQLDGYGVTGTGAIDPQSGTLYVADAFGRLHALALSNGAEQPGWPVRVFSDDGKELVWGALSLVDGAVYVPTASYCDSPMTGGLYRVDTATRRVTRWVSVPASLGGGGGVWGWGGTSYSPALNAIFAVTANAFAGGSNTGSSFTESAGYGEHLVELDPSLKVEASSHPADITAPQDLDFVGSPVVLDRPGCGGLVVAADKNDEVYGWRAGNVAAGPIWDVPLETFDAADPMLSQLAWSPALDSIYAVTGTQLARISIAADCSADVTWKEPLGTKTENGSPTVAGTTVWFAVNGKPTLVAYDGRTGRRVFGAPLGGTTLVAPTIIGDRLLVGTFTGLVEGFSFGAQRSLAAAGAPTATASAVSWAGASDAWESRSTGVFASENGGRSWHEIYPEPALALLRLSPTAGVIELGVAPGPCMCVTRKLWTADDGRTWHETDRIGGDFTGAGDDLYWWQGDDLYLIPGFPPAGADPALTARLVDDVPAGTIVGATPIAGGVAALVSNRVAGQHWDSAPRVLIAHGADVRTVTLPAADPLGEVLAEQIAAEGSRLTVTGTDFAADPASRVTWSSSDGGASWTLER
jgi:PQQ-like domain